MTVFTVVMLAFPMYSHLFYSSSNSNLEGVNIANSKTTEYEVIGMTCSSCEQHIKHELLNLKGVIEARVSYEKSKVEVQFDPTSTDEVEIVNAINSTGYTVVK